MASSILFFLPKRDKKGIKPHFDIDTNTGENLKGINFFIITFTNLFFCLYEKYVVNYKYKIYKHYFL